MGKNAMEKSDEEKEDSELGVKDGNFREGIRENLLEMALVKSLERSEGVSPADIWGKNLPALWCAWTI